MKVTLPTIIDKISTLKDGSIKIVFETREMSPEDSSILFALRKTEGWLLYSSSELSEKDIPKETPTIEKDSKSPSQRLRSVLFVRWKQLGQKGDFESYYRKSVEHFIDQVKEKLT